MRVYHSATSARRKGSIAKRARRVKRPCSRIGAESARIEADAWGGRDMGGLSPMHLAVVLIIALLVFGPKKLPEIGRGLGQAIREFKRASREMMESYHEAAEER